jgi:hypothetical protein
VAHHTPLRVPSDSGWGAPVQRPLPAAAQKGQLPLFVQLSLCLWDYLLTCPLVHSLSAPILHSGSPLSSRAMHLVATDSTTLLPMGLPEDRGGSGPCLRLLQISCFLGGHKGGNQAPAE